MSETFFRSSESKNYDVSIYNIITMSAPLLLLMWEKLGDSVLHNVGGVKISHLLPSEALETGTKMNLKGKV